MSEEQKRLLEQQLWNIANTLRGKMNADEFRDYILGFIFYKYLSEKMVRYADSILVNDGIKYNDIDEATEIGQQYIGAIKEEALDQLGYFLKPSELFSQIAKRGNADVEGETNFILEDLRRILTNIEQSTMGTASEDDFDNLFEDMDLTSTKLGRTESAKNDLIAKVLFHLDKIDFQLENAEIDVLGDAYEYLIGQFAAGAGKKAGEFYTPQQVSMVLAKLVTTGKTKLRSVYDPTCGSGSLLLRVAKEVQEVSNFYGQELNRTTYNLARMNMILHDVHYRKFDIRQEDTLEHPQHINQRFEAIVANPPFSAQWSASPLFMTDDRFSQYGKLAPSSKADFAFVQHMIYHLADNGIMAIVLPHGVLFRGGAEQHIRKYLIEDRNYLDAVIGLPANVFYGTGIPTCILVFKKCRENPEDILFIDASQGYEKVKTQNMLLPQHIEKIISTYRNRNEEEKYSKLATLKTIAENDYNLNIPRYVDTFEAEDSIDINDLASELVELESWIEETDGIIAVFCDELGISTPFHRKIKGVNILTLFEGLEEKLAVKKLQDDFATADLLNNIGANQGGGGNDNWLEIALKKLLPFEFTMEQDKNHAAPHIHINYGRFKHYDSYNIKTGISYHDQFNSKQNKIIMNWISEHRSLLLEIWEYVQLGNNRKYEELIKQLK